MTKVHMTKEELIKKLWQLALDLYVKLEMDRIVFPARNVDEAVGRLCLYARELYERTGGLPVRIFILAGGDKQVIDPETAELELLMRAIYLLESTVKLWRREYRCQTILTTVEHSCDRCFFNVGLETEVVAVSCSYRHRMCVYDFGV